MRSIVSQVRSAMINAQNRNLEASFDDGTIWILPLLEFLDKQNWKCAICRVRDLRSARDLDHIIPISKGGKNTISNVQWTCPDCNLLKQWPQAELRPLNLHDHDDSFMDVPMKRA
jgi:5-methylcytosine-specific restriction endonuclease McrA